MYSSMKNLVYTPSIKNALLEVVNSGLEITHDRAMLKRVPNEECFEYLIKMSYGSCDFFTEGTDAVEEFMNIVGFQNGD